MKTVKKPQPITQLVANNRQLRELARQLQANADLLALVHDHLPDNLRAHCHAAHLQDQQLVLFTDSPAWVMRLRFCSAQVLGAVRATRSNVRGMRVRVQLPERAARRPKRRASLSEQARRHLAETAATIENAALKAALERLSRS